jgi:hypothetical protein
MIATARNRFIGLLGGLLGAYLGCVGMAAKSDTGFGVA